MEIQRRHDHFAPPPDLVIILELPLAEVGRRLEQRGTSPATALKKLTIWPGWPQFLTF